MDNVEKTKKSEGDFILFWIGGSMVVIGIFLWITTFPSNNTDLSFGQDHIKKLAIISKSIATIGAILFLSTGIYFTIKTFAKWGKNKVYAWLKLLPFLLFNVGAGIVFGQTEHFLYSTYWDSFIGPTTEIEENAEFGTTKITTQNRTTITHSTNADSALTAGYVILCIVLAILPILIGLILLFVIEDKYRKKTYSRIITSRFSKFPELEDAIFENGLLVLLISIVATIFINIAS